MEYPCPFCPEDYDLVGLCCHIDEEHPHEDKSGVCIYIYALFKYLSMFFGLLLSCVQNLRFLRNFSWKVQVQSLIVAF